MNEPKPIGDCERCNQSKQSALTEMTFAVEFDKRYEIVLMICDDCRMDSIIKGIRKGRADRERIDGFIIQRFADKYGDASKKLSGGKP